MRNNWIITGALLLCLVAPAVAADGPFYIHRADVNLRAQPNGDIILVFDVNEKVFVIEREGNWSHVSAPVLEEKGWVWSDYLGEGRIAVAPAQQQDPVNDTALVVPAQPVSLVTNVVIEEGQALSPDIQEVNIPVTGQSSQGGGTSGFVELPPRIDSGFVPDAPPLQTETVAIDSGAVTEVPFYRPFERDLDITIPAALGGTYQPVGGNDIALITGSNVNVRSDNSTGSNILGKVNSGDKAYVVSAEESWYLLSIPAINVKGWVHEDFVNQLPRVEITGQDVRLREEPSVGSRIKSELSLGDVFQKFEQSDGWVLVASSASGLKGWVHADYVKKTERLASRPYTIQGDGVNFRTSPAVDSEIIKSLDSGTEVEVLGRNDRWSYIEYSGQQGWMYSQYLQPEFKYAPQRVYGKSIGSRLISRAQEMSGTPYVWGGESDSGVDCSGLIYKLLLDEGASASNLPRRASTQMAGLGQAVDKEELGPGDLVFFTTYKPGPSHVGIYLGDGDFIHASSAQGKVTISNMSDGYYKKRFVGARRISETELKSLK